MKTPIVTFSTVALAALCAGASLTGCGMKPGLYAMPDTTGVPLQEIAILSGTENYRTGNDEGQLVRFVALNGKKLPRQRGGGGVQSLALKPGTYRLTVFWTLPIDTADLYSTPEVDVVAKPNCKYKFTVRKDTQRAYRANLSWSGTPVGPQGNQDCGS